MWELNSLSRSLRAEVGPEHIVTDVIDPWPELVTFLSAVEVGRTGGGK